MGSFYEPRERKKEKRPSRAVSGALHAVGRSDPGCERESNEDRFLLVSRDDMGGYFVFDGMGGQPAGEAAAEISAEVVQRALRDEQGGDLRLLMSHVICLAQEEILSRRGDPATEGMGTTVVGVLMGRNEVVIGAVGDSRAYHIKRGSVTQLTCDHTLVQQLVDAGQLSPHDALVHPQSHILTRCLGSTLDFAVDLKSYRLAAAESKRAPEEWLLLCSDGLYSLVSDEEMAAIVLNFSPEEATLKLIAVARSRGGFDNITALVIPLGSRLVELSEDEVGESDVTVVPALPESRGINSTFVGASEWCAQRGVFGRVVRTIALSSALAITAAVLWFLVFTVK